MTSSKKKSNANEPKWTNEPQWSLHEPLKHSKAAYPVMPAIHVCHPWVMLTGLSLWCRALSVPLRAVGLRVMIFKGVCQQPSVSSHVWPTRFGFGNGVENMYHAVLPIMSWTGLLLCHCVIFSYLSFMSFHNKGSVFGFCLLWLALICFSNTWGCCCLENGPGKPLSSWSLNQLDKWVIKFIFH